MNLRPRIYWIGSTVLLVALAWTATWYLAHTHFKPFERARIWNSAITRRGEGRWSMIALKEKGVVQPQPGHYGWQDTNIIQSTEVWLLTWPDASFGAPSRVERVMIAGESRNQRFYRALEGSGPDAVLMDEHDMLDGHVRLMAWQRTANGFEQSAKADVDELLAVSKGGGKYVARIGSRGVVGDSRTLRPTPHGSGPLDFLLGSVTHWNNAWVTEDGRYVVIPISKDSGEPLSIVGVDLESGTPISLQFAPRDNWVTLSYVESVQGELRLIIGYGQRGKDSRESWSQEIVDSKGTLLRTIPGNNRLNRALWDVAGRRFLIPVDHVDSPYLVILGEGGESTPVIPKMPAEWSTPASR